MNKTGALILLMLFSAACSRQDTSKPHIVIQTTMGDIELELYAKQAPATVAAFLSYVDADLFHNSSFYRVLNQDNQPSNAPKTELIQGGIWRTNNKEAVSLPGIVHESTKQTGILHTDGVISLARLAPGTASSEFFICVGDQPGLNYGGENIADGQGYAAFGKVVKGMAVVRRIYNQNDNDQYLTPPVSIFGIVRR